MTHLKSKKLKKKKKKKKKFRIVPGEENGPDVTAMIGNESTNGATDRDVVPEKKTKLKNRKKTMSGAP